VRVHAWLASLVLTFGFAASAAATTVVPLSDEALASGADMVVLGVVTAVDIAHYEIGPGVFTEVEVRVDERLDATVSTSTVLLRIPGGSSDERTILVPGMPAFELGEEVVLFLELLPQAFGPDGGVAFIPHGLQQGVWREVPGGWIRGEQEGLLPVIGFNPEIVPVELDELRTLVTE
jgi:hypothetical protein